MGEEKSLLQKIMELFRLPRFTRPAAESEADRENGDTDVTVEREPDTASEDAVKGTATADEAAASDAAATSEATPVEEIKGIGPTYAGRLEDAGLDTVEALAGANPDRVAEIAQASETKAGNWVERANEY